MKYILISIACCYWTTAFAQRNICDILIELYNTPNKDFYRDIAQKNIDAYDIWIEDTSPSLIANSKYPPYYPMAIPAHICLKDYNLDYLVIVTMQGLTGIGTDSVINIYDHLTIDSTRVFSIMTRDKKGNPIGFTNTFDIGSYFDITNKKHPLYRKERKKGIKKIFKQIYRSHPDALLYFPSMSCYGYVKDDKIYVDFKERMIEISEYIRGYVQVGLKLEHLDAQRRHEDASYKEFLRKRQ